jgi:hypothetical protein
MLFNCIGAVVFYSVCKLNNYRILLIIKPTVMKKIQLSIPEPCHENWHNMTPTQQGRYCNACAKEVVDFSNMSDSEVLNYFVAKKKADTICGRAYPDQLERDITALPEKKRYWHWYYVLTAFLFFMKPLKTKAQGGVVIVADSAAPVYKIRFGAGEEQSKKHVVSAVVKNETGDAVSFASIHIAGTNRGTATNEQGVFNLKMEGEEMMIEVSALGYETKNVVLNKHYENEITLIKEEVNLREVTVVSSTHLRYLCGVAGGMRVVRTKSLGAIITDTVKSWIPNFTSPIKVYPNPVHKGSSFTINLKLKQTGLYTIQISDAAGRLISEQKINVLVKEWKQNVQSSSTWSGGVYYIKVLDEKGKLFGTGSLVLQ